MQVTSRQRRSRKALVAGISCMTCNTRTNGTIISTNNGSNNEDDPIAESMYSEDPDPNPDPNPECNPNPDPNPECDPNPDPNPECDPNPELNPE